METLKKFGEAVEAYVRPATYPVALKIIKSMVSHWQWDRKTFPVPLLFSL